MSSPRARTAGRVGVIVLVAAACVALAYGETRAARTPSGSPSTTASASTDPVVAAATAGPSAARVPSAAPASASRVLAALRTALGAGGLGARLRADVVDVATGATLLDRTSTATTAPASTAKLLTAAAVLQTRGPDYRIPTSVREASDGTVVLVGGGDPTLSGAARGARPAYDGAARLSDLAAAVLRTGRTPTRVVVDDSAFTGPTVSPDWDRTDVPTEYGAGITAVMTDGGRDTPTATTRSAQPDLGAGRELATLLGHPGLAVARGASPAGAAAVATVRSAPVSELVDQMLMESDNVIAECLGRQVAMVRAQPRTFTGSAAAIRAVVSTLGVDPGAGMRDASGLASSDRLSTRTLTALLRAVATRPSGALGALVSGLPVAGWSGSLADRYLAGSSHAAVGLVRAKTGTLTGVSALAGLVHDHEGRLLAFAFIADRNSSTPAAEAALDDLAADLSACTCG